MLITCVFMWVSVIMLGRQFFGYIPNMGRDLSTDLPPFTHYLLTYVLATTIIATTIPTRIFRHNDYQHDYCCYYYYYYY